MSEQQLTTFVDQYEVRDKEATVRWIQKKLTDRSIPKEAVSRCMDVGSALLDLMEIPEHRESPQMAAALSDALLAMYNHGYQTARNQK